MTTRSPGWHGDPTGEHELRFFDGSEWTELVVDEGIHSISPIANGVASSGPAGPESELPDPEQLPASWAQPSTTMTGTARRADAESELRLPAPPTSRPGPTLGARGTMNGATRSQSRPFVPPPSRALNPPPADAAWVTGGPAPSRALAARSPRSPTRSPPRSWRTWQLAAAAGVALVLGLLVGRATTSGARASTAPPTRARDLPAVLGGGTTVATTTTVSVAAGGKTLSAKGAGDSTSQPFSFPGTWQLAWTYTCPHGSAPFLVTVDNSSGQPEPGTAIISSAGGAGKGTQNYPPGSNLVVKVATTCFWTVKLSA